LLLKCVVARGLGLVAGLEFSKYWFEIAWFIVEEAFDDFLATDFAEYV
jgi:hypothetical protein